MKFVLIYIGKVSGSSRLVELKFGGVKVIQMFDCVGVVTLNLCVVPG